MLLECKNCGGPLDVKSSVRVVKCSYCGMSSSISALRTMSQETPAGWQPPKVWTPPPEFPAPSEPIAHHGSASRSIVLLAVGIALLGGSMMVVLMLYGGDSSAVVVKQQQDPVLVTPVRSTTAPKSPVENWDGRSTLRCSMGEQLVIENRQGSVDGTVIDASNGCKVLIKNSKLKGSNVVDAAMNARVEIENSTLEATSVVIDAAIAAQIKVTKNSRLISKDTGVRLAQAASVRLVESTIEADGVGIDGAMASTIVLERSRVAGKRTSVSAAMGSSVTLIGSKLEGKRKIDSDSTISER